MVTVCVAAVGSTGAPQSCRNWSDDTETVRLSSRELEHAATTSTIDQRSHAIANRIQPPRTGPPDHATVHYRLRDGQPRTIWQNASLQARLEHRHQRAQLPAVLCREIAVAVTARAELANVPQRARGIGGQRRERL